MFESLLKDNDQDSDDFIDHTSLIDNDLIDRVLRSDNNLSDLNNVLPEADFSSQEQSMTNKKMKMIQILN